MRPAALAVLTLLGAGCHRVRPTAPPVPVVGEIAQRSLMPADPYADAERALAERTASRERRFREAWEPGSLWRPLRVEQRDVETGRIGLRALAEVGRQLFALDFGVTQGLGNGLGALGSKLAGPAPAPNLRHVHYREFGGPDGTRCLGCHHVGGDGGGGFRADNSFLDGDGERPASGLERNPRALVGAALLQLVAEEMSAELKEQARLLRSFGGSRPVALSAKGVAFGVARGRALGDLDLSGVEGVDRDLTVRPFGWKGDTATLREAVERALQQNLGVQPERWLADPRIRGDAARVGDGPRADDPDNDGIGNEATDGMVSALTLYIAALAPPIEEMPEDPSFLMRANRGAELFRTIGCVSCHVPELPLRGTVVSLGPRPGAAPRVDLAPLLTAPGREHRLPSVRLYSDLKRHDMGEALAEPRDHRGVSRRHWLTPPLWGVAASAPYLHDGRASSVDEAILAHDGEAREARDAYRKLSYEDQGAVHLFLMVLDRPHHLEFRR